MTIFASGSVDEHVLEMLQEKNAPIDGFGIGTHMDTSADAPYLDCAYKLVEYGGKARRKRSKGKVLWPGRKQVFRSYGDDARMLSDVLGLEGEKRKGEELIRLVMKGGQRVSSPVPLRELRERTLNELNRLPAWLRGLKRAGEYSVVVSEAIHDLARQVDAAQQKTQAGGEE